MKAYVLLLHCFKNSNQNNTFVVNLESEQDKKSKDFFQKRVDEILSWYPTKDVKGRMDLSGIGLEK